LFLASFLLSVCPAAEAIVDHYITLQLLVLLETAAYVVMNYNTFGRSDRNLAAQRNLPMTGA
jgi:hypothetical protein